MSDSPQAEPARTRRSSRNPVTPAPALPAPALTRGELRRRAQAGENLATSVAAEAVEAAAPPLTRRAVRPRVEPLGGDDLVEVPLEQLPDLAPEALRLSDEVSAADLSVVDLTPEVSVVVETAAADVDTDPASLATGPIVVPRRRARRAASPAIADLPADVEAAASARPAPMRPAGTGDPAATRPARTGDPAGTCGSEPNPHVLAGSHVLDEPAEAESDTADAFTVPPIPVRETSIDDEFEAAAKLFAFSDEIPVQVAAEALAADEPAESQDAAPRRRLLGLRRIATASFSIGVLGAVGLLTVGMTTPLEAVAAAKGAPAAITALGGDVAATEDLDDIQAYVAPAQVQSTAIERSEDYETTTFAEIAAESGISNFSNFFVSNPNSPIQWPFAVGVPITYGFGMRSGTMHEGLDFVPGAGSPVQAIADGTVRIATESGGAYGVTVVIDHEIDGELVSSRSAHLQYGSLQVDAGDRVTVGTFIGRTGNTGRSFGAHTHFEILQNGTTAIDPLPWLREHAGG